MVVSASREHLAAVIESATRTGEPVSLTRRGRSVAVVVDPAVCERVLTGNPRPPACVAMSGEQDVYRVRVGDFWMLYEVIDALLIIHVVRVGHGREVYR